jgi:hypothetical protein
MPTMKAWDAVNGAEGICYSVVDGNREEMIYVRNIEAVIKKNKSEIKVLGQTGAKHKANGWKGTGKMNLYYVTSYFRKMMSEYVKNGVDTYFDLHIINEDPSSDIGKQHIWLKKVNIDSIVIAKLNINSTELDEDVEFTFDDIEIMTEFDQIVGE